MNIKNHYPRSALAFRLAAVFIITCSLSLGMTGSTPAGSAAGAQNIGMVERSGSITAPIDLNDDIQDIRLVNHNGGAPGPVVVQGGYAYVGFSYELAVFDISDPLSPVRIGFLMLPFTISQLCEYGDYVFAAGAHHLSIIDSRTPGALVQLGSYSYEGYPGGLAANTSHIFLSTYPTLRIIDYADPTKLVQVAEYDPPGSPGGLFVRGQYLYIAEGGDGLNPVPEYWGGMRILDISDPASPREVSFTVTSRVASDIVLVGSLAYLLNFYSGLSILDISNPQAPVILGYAPIGRYLGDLSVVGDTAYIASFDVGLAIVDISDSTAPTVVGYYWPTYGFPEGSSLAAVPGAVYLGGGSSMLQVVDVSNPGQSALASVIGGPRWVSDLDIQEDYIYMVVSVAGLPWPKSRGGLWIMDKSNPLQIEFTGYAYENCAGAALAVSEGYAFLGCNWGALQVYDISDPQKPVLQGSARFDGNAQEIEVAGDYAYIVSTGIYNAENIGGLRIFDISDPSTPVFLSYSPVQDASSVVIRDQYVYVASPAGLWIFDGAVPANPTQVNTLNEFAGIDLVIDGQALYMAGAQGLFIFDITDPVNPVNLGGYHTLSQPVSLAVDGRLAYLSIWDGVNVDSGGELLVINVYDQVAPYLTGRHPLYGYFYDGKIVLDEQYAYVGGFEGFSILEYGYRVSGLVTDVRGLPYTDAVITAGDGVSTTTRSDGIYQLFNLDAGQSTLKPSLPGYAFYPSSRTVQTPPDASGANFTLLPAPASATITPQAASTLVYTDTQGLPTTFEIPPGAVPVTSTLTVTPTLAYGAGGSAFAGHAFELGLSTVGESQQSLDFDAPITVTIRYSSLDVGVISDLDQLGMYWWDGNAWMPAQETCQPGASPDHDPLVSRFTVQVCSIGRYALFGPTHAVRLPYVERQP